MTANETAAPAQAGGCPVPCCGGERATRSYPGGPAPSRLTDGPPPRSPSPPPQGRRAAGRAVSRGPSAHAHRRAASRGPCRGVACPPAAAVAALRWRPGRPCCWGSATPPWWGRAEEAGEPPPGPPASWAAPR